MVIRKSTGERRMKHTHNPGGISCQRGSLWEGFRPDVLPVGLHRVRSRVVGEAPANIKYLGTGYSKSRC